MTYSSSSAYRALFVGAATPLGAKELWKVAAPAKVKHFFWLAMHRRCWTAARRHRRGLQQSPNCVLCTTGIEEIDHILLSCAFSRQVWNGALGIFGLAQLQIEANDTFWSWWLRSRKRVAKHLWKGFDSSVFLVGWQLWKERNRRTFGEPHCTSVQVMQGIVDEACQCWMAGYKHLQDIADLVPLSHIGMHVI